MEWKRVRDKGLIIYYICYISLRKSFKKIVL